MAGPVEPGAGGAAAVLLKGASALAAAPATLKLPVGLEAEAAALPLGCTLVEGTAEGRTGRSNRELQRTPHCLPPSCERDRNRPVHG